MTGMIGPKLAKQNIWKWSQSIPGTTSYQNDATIAIRSIGRDFLKAPFECCPAPLITRNRDVIQDDRQYHIETERDRQAFPAIVLRRWVEGRNKRKVNRQQADDQTGHTSDHNPGDVHEALAGDCR